MLERIASKLFNRTKLVKENAYSPYSGYKVGSSLICVKNGKIEIIDGVNVENATYGPTNCAERSAIFTSATKGFKPGEIFMIAVSASCENFSPCGVCRQVINEFAIKYIVYEFNKELKIVSLDELLPDRFILEDNKISDFENIDYEQILEKI